MDEVLVIDLGGTKTNVSFIKSNDSKINVISSDVFPTCSDPKLQIESIISIASSKNKKINSLSLSLPGRWNKNGILQESFFLHKWLEYPFIEKLANNLNVKNYAFETDVICAALGEYHYGVGISRDQPLLYINLGTGIGAALIKDGKPFKSPSKPTLRMQKLVIPFQDELFSGVDLISGGTLTGISKYGSVEKLFSDYKLAKIEALDIISKAQTQLAAWLINLFYLLAPELIVLGGGLTNDWDVLVEGAIDLAKEELENEVEILPGKLKDLAPIYGAYINFCQMKSHNLAF
ncbi:MAG: ROK family protein [Candidatus Melainabacteria bacterium]|nr:ROK family protein [Candidatus Melainabacteria bacterium]